MEWIKTISPLIGVIIGWLLAESGRIISDKRQDKRKIKKLLYFLLEIRFHFEKELNIELDLSKYLSLIKLKLSEKLGISINDPELNLEIDILKPILLELLSKTKISDNKFDFLSKNIDEILVELAEIYPILAHELSGQHNIKERLNNANNYLSELEVITNQVPFDFKEWINPKLTKSLLDDLDKSIEKIAIKVDKNILKILKANALKMNDIHEDENINPLVEEYLNKILEKIAQAEMQ